MNLVNTPEVKLGMVAVSRDCFPLSLSRERAGRLAAAAKGAGLDIFLAETVVENETDVAKALAELRGAGVNAAVVYLGNFGPEGPTTIMIKKFHGPVMVCAAAEEAGDALMTKRGDAYCGMLNLSYNLALRGLRAHIPESPVGLPEQLAGEIKHFVGVARVVIGLAGLKVFGFGPRPHDFYACNAPIKPLYDLGVEVMENSELDMLQLFQEAAGRKEVDSIAADMARELGAGNTYPELLRKLAQFELALTNYMEANLGSRKFGVFANKCWPAFEKAFGFVPCYVNSRLAGRGIPVACEVDLYGAVSEYMAQLASNHPATLLDINNTVPADMSGAGAKMEGYTPGDLFMGFHCGNTPSCCLKGGCAIKYQVIMHSLMEPDKEPDITRGTLEGSLKPGSASIFRVQSTAGCELRGYLADGAVLDIDPRSFGAIGVIAVKGMSRFYRHVLIGGNFPHHTALAFQRCGRVLFDAFKLATGKTPATPKPEGLPYPEENPFA